jgi:hypothetical protein
MNPGLMDSGLMDPGLMDSGLMDPGLMDSGLVHSGRMDRPGAWAPGRSSFPAEIRTGDTLR